MSAAKPPLGSIEHKSWLLRTCMTKMSIGAVMLLPILMTQAQHRFGQAGSGLLVLLFFPLATVFFVLACMDYARSKGLPPAMGFLGLASIFGLAILSFWPDKYPYSKEALKQRKAGRS